MASSFMVMSEPPRSDVNVTGTGVNGTLTSVDNTCISEGGDAVWAN